MYLGHLTASGRSPYTHDLRDFLEWASHRDADFRRHKVRSPRLTRSQRKLDPLPCECHGSVGVPSGSSPYRHLEAIMGTSLTLSAWPASAACCSMVSAPVMSPASFRISAG